MKSAAVVPDFRYTPVIDQVGVEERVARFSSRSIKKESKVQGLKLALSMIDLTTLEGKDTEGRVRQMCYKAAHLHDVLPGLPTVAAVCVYPTHVKTAKDALKGTGIKVASVATAFPSGNATLDVKIADTKFAVESGADEIDMVIARGEFLRGNYSFVFDEIAAVKEACGKARLKVILETGELSTLDNVRRASDIAIYAGADFIKTSTGFSTGGASVADIELLRKYVGPNVRVKASGGVRDVEFALALLAAGADRIGTSSGVSMMMEPDTFVPSTGIEY